MEDPPLPTKGSVMRSVIEGASSSIIVQEPPSAGASRRHTTDGVSSRAGGGGGAEGRRAMHQPGGAGISGYESTRNSTARSASAPRLRSPRLNLKVNNNRVEVAGKPLIVRARASSIALRLAYCIRGSLLRFWRGSCSRRFDSAYAAGRAASPVATARQLTPVAVASAEGGS